MSFTYQMEQKTSMEQVVPITCALEKRLFVSATFEGKCR